MTTSVWIPTGSEQAVQLATAALNAHGFRVVRSFDWRSAVEDCDRCACTHHGTAHCTCQYIVLLVYGLGSGPLTITAHSCDTNTELQVVDDPNAPPNTMARSAALAALAEAAGSAAVAHGKAPHAA